MATNFANSRLVTRLGSDWLLLWGTSGAALAGIVLAVAAWINLGALAGLALPLFLFVSPTGFSRRPFLEKISPRPRDAGYSPSADLRRLGVIGPLLWPSRCKPAGSEGKAKLSLT